jgi:ferritin-like metal-binding protein YciE
MHTLRNIYHDAKQILKAFPKMTKNAESEELQGAFEKHRDQTESQVDRLEKIFLA